MANILKHLLHTVSLYVIIIVYTTSFDFSPSLVSSG